MRRHAFTLMEAIMAGTTFVLVLTFAFAGINLCRDMQIRFMRQQTALSVLDNTLERLSAEQAPDSAHVREVLRHEFESDACGHDSGLSARCREERGMLALEIVDRHGHALSSVEVKLQ